MQPCRWRPSRGWPSRRHYIRTLVHRWFSFQRRNERQREPRERWGRVCGRDCPWHTPSRYTYISPQDCHGLSTRHSVTLMITLPAIIRAQPSKQIYRGWWRWKLLSVSIVVRSLVRQVYAYLRLVQKTIIELLRYNQCHTYHFTNNQLWWTIKYEKLHVSRFICLYRFDFIVSFGHFELTASVETGKLCFQYLRGL